MSRKNKKNDPKLQQTQTISINEGESFFAHQTDFVARPGEFVLNFKNVVPIKDARGNVTKVKHNTIILSPLHMKDFAQKVNEIVKNYEDLLGEITKSDAVLKAEKLNKEQVKKLKIAPSKTDKSNYFG